MEHTCDVFVGHCCDWGFSGLRLRTVYEKGLQTRVLSPSCLAAIAMWGFRLMSLLAVVTVETRVVAKIVND